MRVLGIDPGLRCTGYGCIQCADAPPGAWHGAGGGITLVEGGVVRLDGKTSVADRLVELDADLAEVIERTRPDIVAVEKLYAHYRHPTTAIVMGHARGVILLAARRAGLAIVELGANEVKKALTSFGHAGKGQMQDAVRLVLGLAERPEPADVADAIAVALCCASRHERISVMR